MHSSAVLLAMDKSWTITCLLVLMAAAAIDLTTAAITEVNYDLLENTGVGYSVGNLQTNAATSGGSEYKFSNGSNCIKYLNLFPSGEIQTKVNIDREYFIETKDKDTMTCVVEYKAGSSSNKLSVIVTITIQDVNDVVPRFFGLQQPEDNRTVYENLPNGSIVLYLMPYDLDKGDNGTVDFTIIKGNEENYFKLRPPANGNNNSPDRVLYLNNGLDYEQIPMFNLTFMITDHGNPALVSYQNLLIHLIDVNDQDPAFEVSHFYFDLPEDHPIGRDHPFGRVNASDQDSPTHAQIFYNLKEPSDIFEVNITTGELYLMQSLDYDSGPTTLKFSVVARNPGVLLGTDAEIEVTILDINDEAPSLISNIVPQVYENSANVQLISVVFEDLDKESPNNQIMVDNITVSFSPPINYTIARTQIISLGLSTLFTITIEVNEILDREETPVLNITFLVTDNGSTPLTSSITVSIDVLDLNDNAPHFTQDKFYSKVLEASIPDRYALTVTAIDPDLGENSEFQFSITSVKPTMAQDWFFINASTGDLYLVSQPSYSSVDGLVEIFITATDYASNSNTTVVEMSILPPFTFEPNSFQEFSNVYLIGSSSVYIEFKTDHYNSSRLLLYQRSLEQQFPLLEAYLQLMGDKIVYSNGSQQIEKTFNFRPNNWYSVLIETMNDIQVWEKGTDVNSEAIRLLQTTALGLCSEQQMTTFQPVSPYSALSVGGVSDIFDIIPNGGGTSSPVDNTANQVTGYDFNGQIAAVIIGDRQLDMSCPLRQKRAVSGSHFAGHLCSQFTDSCNAKYSSCVSYVAEERDVCQCKSGFPSDSCDEEADYNPVSMANGSHVQLILGYDYFFSAYQHLYTSYSSDSNTAQTIIISFTPGANSPAGVLFYSKTKHSVNVLEIDQTLRYTVRDSKYVMLWNSISEKLPMTSGTEYTIEMKILTNDELISLTFGEANKEARQLKLTKSTFTSTLQLPYKFAEQPTTAISIGGLTDNHIPSISRTFKGCVTQFSIDGAPLPLNNFIRTGYLNTTIVGDKNNLSLTCHACYNSTKCSSGNTCSIIGPLRNDMHTCTCDRDCVDPTTVGTPVPVTTVTPRETVTDGGGGQMTGSIETPPDKTGLNMIVGISAGSLFMVVLTVVLLTLIIRCAYVKGKKKRSFKFVTQVTYHQKDNSQPEQDAEAIPMSKHTQNNYIDTPIKHIHCSSTDDSAIDGVVHSPLSLRESMSQETGFHTASEFDPPSRQSSPRRAYDSCKSSSEQYDSDIETDSESLNTSGIEENCQSPHILHMGKGGGGVPMGNGSVPPHYLRNKPVLSSKERLALTPLHPSNAMLLTEDETGSEVSTTTNTTNRHFDEESILSNGPKWYKMSSPSTIVSNDDGTDNSHILPAPTSHHHPQYHSHTLDSYYNKRSKRKLPPSTFKPHKSNSPPHYYVAHNGHSPLSTSPLVQKAHRFDYPPYSPASVSSRGSRYESVDPAPTGGGMVIPPPAGLSPKLPVIDESGQYIHHPPPPPHHYHVRQHSDHSYLDNMHHHPPPPPPPPHPQVHPDMMNPVPYYPGYQGTNLTPGGGAEGTKYCDLNSFAQMNPISYWEQQQRLRPTVDDGLGFLMEPYTKFEDVSTTPSVVESTIIDGDDESIYNGGGHEYGGTRRPITSRGLHEYNHMYPPPHMRSATLPPSSNTSSQVSMPTRLSKIPRSRRNSERESPSHNKEAQVVSNGIGSSQEDLTGTQEDNGTGYPITHFPSADCRTPTFLSRNHDDKPGTGGGMLDSTSTLAAPVDLSED